MPVATGEENRLTLAKLGLIFDVKTSKRLAMGTGSADQEQEDEGKDIVISLRLDAPLAQEFRMEAARRGMRLKALFAEMWAEYRRTHDAVR